MKKKKNVPHNLVRQVQYLQNQVLFQGKSFDVY